MTEKVLVSAIRKLSETLLRKPLKPKCKKKSPKKVPQVTPEIEESKSFVLTPVAKYKKKQKIQEDKGVIKITKVTQNEYDIFSIDLKIKESFEQKFSTLPTLKKDLDTLMWVMTKGEDPVDKVIAKKNAAILKRRIKDAECCFELGLYLLKTAPLLEEYKKLCSSETISFVRVPQKDTNVARKNEIILSYMRIASCYIKFDGIATNTTKLTCPNCKGIDFDSTLEIDYICKGCGGIIDILDDSPSFKDTDRANLYPRYTYTLFGHYKDAILQYQGLQNRTIDDKIYDILDEERQADNIAKENYTKDHLYLHLANRNLSDYYEDMNLIYSRYTNKPCPDITKYTKDLYAMFPIVEAAYQKVKDASRSNSLNVNFKLFKCLEILGYPCKKDDFYFLRTPAKLKEHMEKWRELIECIQTDKRPYVTKFNWRYIPTI